MTECSICLGKLINPKCLPCLHAFCCQCLERLSSSNPGRVRLPCPNCRSTFKVPAGGCSKLPPNVFAEEVLSELSRVERKLEETETNLNMLRIDHAGVNAELQESKDARQKAVNEKRHLSTALAESKSKHAKLEKRLSQMEQQLESRVGDLERKLSAAESREPCLLEVHREMGEKMEEAERRHEAAQREVEICRKAKNDAEASMAKEKQSCQKLQQQLQQMQRVTSEQLKDAALRRKAAEREARIFRKAKNDVGASLAKEKQSYQNLHQQLKKREQSYQDLHQQLQKSEQSYQDLHQQLKKSEQSYEDLHQQLQKSEQSHQNLHQQLQKTGILGIILLLNHAVNNYLTN